MKKNILIPIIVGIILVLGIVVYLLLNNNKIASTITMDINPSVEINLDKNEKVINVKALNEDAKKIVNDNFKGKKLDDVVNVIADKVIELGYVNERELVVLVHATGTVSTKTVQEKVESSFREKDPRISVIPIENITKEDEELAKKYNITPAKANYVKAVADSNENIKIDDLVNKSISELKDTKETGNYCLDGYMLEGSWCLKEIGRKAAKGGKVCPSGYKEYNGKCYEETGVIDTENIFCPEGFTLENSECIKKNYIDATVESYSCAKGMVKTKGEVGMAPFESGPAKEAVCVDTKVTHAVTVCNLPASDPTERMSYGGKCYWHRAPVIASGCPGKIQINGFCWDSAEGVYMCPNGYNSNKRTKDDECYTVLKNIKPTISSYKCDVEGMILEGNKCVTTEKADVIHKRTCPEKATLIDNDYCINLDKISEKVDGFICDEENTKPKGNECIVYEVIEAYQK